tara:strand:- start:6006 stop:6983 length:978 start_codon:yes stop_codon:yes gene_type:complete
MSENLAKFNNAMSQFQSGQDGINNYLQKQGNELASRASSAISDSLGVSQEDKERLDDAIGMLAGAAPIGLGVGKKLLTRAGGRLGLTAKVPTKLTGKGAETAKAGESAKGESSEGGEGVGEESANAGVPKTGSEMTNMEGEGQSVKATEFSEDELFSKPLGSTPLEGPGTSTSAGSGAQGTNPGEDAADGGEDADFVNPFGEDAAEGGQLAGEGGEAAAAGGEAAAAGEGAAVAGEGAAAGATAAETAAAFIPVAGEVLVAAAAGYAIYEGITDLFGGGSHDSAVKKAFSGDVATSGATTAFTTGSYAVASADGVTTQTGGSSAF